MKSIKIYDYWCAQQQQDYENIMQAVDNVGAASLALATNGAQAYQQFIDARENFKHQFTEITKHYRYVEH